MKLRYFGLVFGVLLISACGEDVGNDQGLRSTHVKFTSGQAASVVIGQADYVSRGAQLNSAGLEQPYTNVFVDSDGGLYIPDYLNNRILVYPSLPTQNGESAAMVVGQPDFTTDWNVGPNENHMNGPITPYVYDNKLFVIDYGNHRLAIYNTVPSTSPGTIDVVIGQSDKVSNITSCTASTLKNPEAVTVVDGKIIVADGKNNRVLIWNSIPTTDGATADLVIGQETFDSCLSNGSGLGAYSMNFPTAVWSDGTKLVVSDTNNNRVLIWNSFPTQNGQEADVVLGQKNMYSVLSNRGASAAADTLSNPYEGLHSLNGQLAVVDSYNHRVLIWETFPTENGQAADVVIGQPDFTTTVTAATAEGLNSPAGVFLHDDKMIVTDRANNRVLIYSGQVVEY